MLLLKHLFIIFSYGRAIRKGAKPDMVRPLFHSKEIVLSQSSSIEVIRSTYQKGLLEWYTNAKISHHHPLAFAQDGGAITSSSNQAIANFRANRNFIRPYSTLHNAEVIEKGVLVDNWYGHYGHWLFEHFPAILAAQIPRETCIIINRGEPAQIKTKILRSAGYDNIFIYTGRPIKVRKLGIISGPPNSPYLTSTLRNYIIERFGAHKQNTPNRIYISRQTSSRKASNFSQLSTLLKKFEITIIDPTKYSFQQQMVMYTNANLMIGIQGSGMRNAIFMKQGTAIELHGDFREYGQEAIIKTTPVNYVALQSIGNPGKNNPIEVNIPELEQVLSGTTNKSK